jgi:hypothetical protein
MMVKVYPNPTSGEITIELENLHSQEMGYSVVDLIGRVLQNGAITKNVSQLDLSKLSKGVYFLQLHDSSGIYSLTKIFRD